MGSVRNRGITPGLSSGSIRLSILACLAIVTLACGLKNYLVVFVGGTALCPYLCPSLFPSEFAFTFPLLDRKDAER